MGRNLCINKHECRERLFSGESFNDLPTNNVSQTQSVLIPKPNNIRDNRFYSVLEKKKIMNLITEITTTTMSTQDLLLIP